MKHICPYTGKELSGPQLVYLTALYADDDLPEEALSELEPGTVNALGTDMNMDGMSHLAHGLAGMMQQEFWLMRFGRSLGTITRTLLGSLN